MILIDDWAVHWHYIHYCEYDKWLLWQWAGNYCYQPSRMHYAQYDDILRTEADMLWAVQLSHPYQHERRELDTHISAQNRAESCHPTVRHRNITKHLIQSVHIYSIHIHGIYIYILYSCTLWNGNALKHHSGQTNGCNMLMKLNSIYVN